MHSLVKPLLYSVFSAFVLIIIFGLQSNGLWWMAGTVQPLNPNNWLGFLSPLLHGSSEHLLNNAFAVITLGTIAGYLYPKIVVRALPFIWFVSVAITWGFGIPGSHHLGASGITYGLMAVIAAMALYRRDRPSIAALFVVVLFFGGAIWGFFPTDGISAVAHFGGALGGILSVVLFHQYHPRSNVPKATFEENIEDINQPGEWVFNPYTRQLFFVPHPAMEQLGTNGNSLTDKN